MALHSRGRHLDPAAEQAGRQRRCWGRPIKGGRAGACDSCRCRPRKFGFNARIVVNWRPADRDTRFSAAPDIPAFREMGLPAVSHSEWWALFAPKGTPKDVIGKLHAAAVEALGDPAVHSRLAEIGAEIFPRERQTPEALRHSCARASAAAPDRRTCGAGLSPALIYGRDACVYRGHADLVGSRIDCRRAIQFLLFPKEPVPTSPMAPPR